MHVYGEAKRVFEFQNVCLGLSPYNGNLLEVGRKKITRIMKNYTHPFLQSLGGLMNQSQDSCRDLFGCSCPELDDLVKLCRLDEGGSTFPPDLTITHTSVLFLAYAHSHLHHTSLYSSFFLKDCWEPLARDSLALDGVDVQSPSYQSQWWTRLLKT